MRGNLAIVVAIAVVVAGWAFAMFLVLEPHFFLPSAS
jgi:hypothetical protein